ncbi:hypothetical protein LP420_19015 [Massilia sp. B-10]|nr:hypothetical protein LP420_19015 [Massilia sp. B-10]UUZ56813.1 hypothetical protein LP419_18455 [Massilia sp. H-1]
MVNQEQQDGNANAPAAPAAIPPLSPQGASRRRLAGLGVSGVVLTVASNHAMAGLVCKSPSGALSGDLNSQSPNVTCNGVSPGYWKTHPSSWPSQVKTSDKFSQHFACNGPLSTLTCMQILSKQGADKSNVGMHVMATYLNVLSGRISFLTAQAVLDIWAQYNTYGSYTPQGASSSWSGGQLVDYLSSTMS